jgi:hypothetical protein
VSCLWDGNINSFLTLNCKIKSKNGNLKEKVKETDKERRNDMKEGRMWKGRESISYIKIMV